MKKWVSNNCCCCIKKSDKANLEFDRRQNVASIHLPNIDSTSGIINKAYDGHQVVIKQPAKEGHLVTKKQNKKLHIDTQVSDHESNFTPSVIEQGKSLSDLVFEELDRSQTLQSPVRRKSSRFSAPPPQDEPSTSEIKSPQQQQSEDLNKAIFASLDRVSATLPQDELSVEDPPSNMEDPPKQVEVSLDPSPEYAAAMCKGGYSVETGEKCPVRLAMMKRLEEDQQNNQGSPQQSVQVVEPSGNQEPPVDPIEVDPVESQQELLNETDQAPSVDLNESLTQVATQDPQVNLNESQEPSVDASEAATSITSSLEANEQTTDNAVMTTENSNKEAAVDNNDTADTLTLDSTDEASIDLDTPEEILEVKNEEVAKLNVEKVEEIKECSENVKTSDECSIENASAETKEPSDDWVVVDEAVDDVINVVVDDVVEETVDDEVVQNDEKVVSTSTSEKSFHNEGFVEVSDSQEVLSESNTNSDAKNGELSKEMKKLPSMDMLKDADKENEKVVAELDDSIQENRAVDDLIEDKVEDVVTPSTKISSTEWRDKLRRELLEDDVTFDDVTSSTCSDVTTEMTSLIVDAGSYEIRTGFSPNFQPQHKHRSVIGRWRDDVTEAWREEGFVGGDFLFGEEAIRRRQCLNLKEIFTNGVVNNWRDMTSLLNYVTDDLDCDVTNHNIVMSENVGVGRKETERKIEMLIETMRFSGVLLRSQAQLALYSQQADSGIVVNCGHYGTQVAPIYEGYQLNHACKFLEFGGKHIDEQLSRLIQEEKGISLKSVGELEAVNSIKHLHSFVNLDGDQLRSKRTKVEIHLPDGRDLEVDEELWRCVEPIFNPEIVGINKPGIPQLVLDSIDLLSPDTLVQPSGEIKVVLCGGVGCYTRNIKERLQMEINNKSYLNIKVENAECGSNAAWVGGSMLADQDDNFNDLLITEKQFAEHGSRILANKIF